MIYSISGRLSDILDDSAIVEVQGLGYQVLLPYSYLAKLPGIGADVYFYTYHYIREDQQLLFGFLSSEEKQFFIKLTSVSGVGPKIAMKMMSDLSVQDIANAILQGNIAILTSLSGVGKKMAERLIIELKDKLDFVISHKQYIQGDPLVIDKEFENDLFMALKSLGYAREEIKRALTKASAELNSELSLEQCIKVVLKKI
jgi:Holliday junction DNA helicase RuvA